MATGTASRRLRVESRQRKNGNHGRFDRRLAEILEHATAVFDAKGYEGASMRDLSRAAGMSLAGLYHYFESKERLLYLIQKHTFSTILESLRGKLEGVSDPEQRVRVFIGNHLEYFLANQKAMKVLSHEDDVLRNGYGAEVRALKREYYRTASRLVEAVLCAQGVQSRTRVGVRVQRDSAAVRTAVLSLFGIINWIYTWYNPRVDGDASRLSQEMGDLFLHGIVGAGR